MPANSCLSGYTGMHALITLVRFMCMDRWFALYTQTGTLDKAAYSNTLEVPVRKLYLPEEFN